jgi:hypothetical protein
MGRRTTAAGHEVADAIHDIAFVVVNVPRAHKKAGVKCCRNLGQVVPQRDLVGSRIVIHLDMLLNIGDRRMMQRDNH